MNGGALDPRVRMAKQALADVGRVIMVCSVKGGVGKSTVAVGLASGLSRMGRKVGLVDLDFRATPIKRMTGVSGNRRGNRTGIVPLIADGVKVMSAATEVGEQALPVGGSEAESLVVGFLSVVNWGRLDYLVADMPPGMGDELMALLRLAGSRATALLVTTPSVLSLDAVLRLVSLLREEGVGIVGLVENMSYITCDCGNILRPFGEIDESRLREAGLARPMAKLPIDPEVEKSVCQGLGVLDTPVLGEGIRRLALLVDGSGEPIS